MAPALQVKLLKVATNLRKTVMHSKIQHCKIYKVTISTLQTYFGFVFLYNIVYIQSKFSIISSQRIFLCFSFHKKPICHVRDIWKVVIAVASLVQFTPYCPY